MALTINSAGQGKRTTAADLLVDAPGNLSIVTDTPVERVILDGKMAVGVDTGNKKCTSPNSPPQHPSISNI
jgi:hypothetical protein